MSCERCHKESYVLQRFQNKWVCMDCYNTLKNKRDKHYYARLRLYNRIKAIEEKENAKKIKR